MSDVKIDILGGLYWRNMFNIIGSILDCIPPPALSNLIQTTNLYKEIVENDKKTRLRLIRWWSWLMFEPDLRPVCVKDGHMVTSLATAGDSIIFGILGYDASVMVFDKETLQCTAEMVQSREFPGSISAVDYNKKLVVTSTYEAYQGANLTHAAYVWNREDKSLACKILPHAEMIRAVKLTSNYILTGSNDCSIVVTDITNPQQPNLLHRLTDHQDYISSLDADKDHFVSVSVDNILKVWSLRTFKCIHSLETVSSTLKVAMRWPVAVTGGQTKVLLWNIETGCLMRTLTMNTDSYLSSLTMTRREERDAQSVPTYQDVSTTEGEGVFIAAGDNQGVVALWDTSILVHGWDRLKDCTAPHRYIQIGYGGNMISSLSLSGTSLTTGDWLGRVLVWQFIKNPQTQATEIRNSVSQSIEYAV